MTVAKEVIEFGTFRGLYRNAHDFKGGETLGGNESVVFGDYLPHIRGGIGAIYSKLLKRR